MTTNQICNLVFFTFSFNLNNTIDIKSYTRNYIAYKYYKFIGKDVYINQNISVDGYKLHGNWNTGMTNDEFNSIIAYGKHLPTSNIYDITIQDMIGSFKINIGDVNNIINRLHSNPSDIKAVKYLSDIKIIRQIKLMELSDDYQST